MATKLYREDIEAAIARLEANPANAFLLNGSDKNKVSNIVYLLLTAALEIFFVGGVFKVPKPWHIGAWVRFAGIVIKLVKDAVDIINGSKIEAVDTPRRRRRRKTEEPSPAQPATT